MKSILISLFFIAVSVVLAFSCCAQQKDKPQANFSVRDYSVKADYFEHIFKKNTSFGNDRFRDTAFFSEAEFDHSADFTAAFFFKQADFGLVHFKGFPCFTQCNFGREASFAETEFDKMPQFITTSFREKADFYGAQFKEGATFAISFFYGETKFTNAVFNGPVIFAEALFRGNLILNNLKTTDSTYFIFENTSFGDSIDLSYNPLIYHDIDLTIGDFRGRNDSVRHDIGVLTRGARSVIAYFSPYTIDKMDSGFVFINLYHTDIAKIKMDYEHFRLCFSVTNTAEDFTIDIERPLSKDQKSSVYESLLKNFRDRGQVESEKKLAIEYEYFKGEDSWKVYVKDWWNRFGYEKQRIFKHTFLFLFLFTVVTFFFLPFLQKNIYTFGYFEANESYQHESVKLKFWTRLWYSLVYTSTIFFLLSLKIDKLQFSAKPKHIFGLLYILLIYTVGIICIAYMANFVLAK